MAAREKRSNLPALPALPAKGEPLGRELQQWLADAHALAQRGDGAAADALIALYRERPDYLDRLSVLASVAEIAWIDALTPKGAGQAALTRQVAEREVGRLKDDLAAGEADPLERLLIDRIAAAWAAAHYADKLLADGLATNGMAWAQIEYRARHAERMGRAFLRASEALARVRRLRLGAVQVNIADKQINVAR